MPSFGINAHRSPDLRDSALPHPGQDSAGIILPAHEKQTILVVDDTPANVLLLEAILSTDYNVHMAGTGEDALRMANGTPAPDLILLDVVMPGMDGFEVCRRLKASSVTRNIPVIFVTALDRARDEALGFEIGAADYIHKPVTSAIVKARVRNHLAFYLRHQELERLVRERTQELSETRLQIIRRLGRAGEFRDNETGLHVVRVGHYCRLIAQAIGMDEGEAELLYYAAPMHDIGKIGIRDHLLLKPGKLTREEFAEIQKHPEIGADIIGDIETGLLGTARTIALTHHEKWDGTGYPRGLRGEAIPLAARIFAIVDVWDALRSDRPYRSGWTTDAVREHIARAGGTHFDPAVVEAFLTMDMESVSGRWSDGDG